MLKVQEGAKTWLANVMKVDFWEKPDDVAKSLVDRRATLLKYDSAEEVDKVLKPPGFTKSVEELFQSDINDGVIDPDNEQQLALLYFRLKRQQNPTVASKRDEFDASIKQLGDSLDWADYEDGVQSHIEKQRPSGGKEPAPKIYKVAILGTGASVAYYLVNAGGTLDVPKTVVIGESQPWRTERGKDGVVNHPMHMIAPEYQDSTLTGPEGLAPRQQFSDRVEEAVQKFPCVLAKVQSVAKLGEAVKYFEITTSAGAFYAQKVIAGVGIGKHKPPDNVEGKGFVDSQGNIPRLMDMDQFQRAIAEGNLASANIQSIAVVGPNAAIDVMSTALRTMQMNPLIYWITGSDDKGAGKRPVFLKGTDNEYVEMRYDEVVKQGKKSGDKKIFQLGVITIVGYDYLKATVSGSGVEVTYGKRKIEKTPEVVEGAQQVDIAVYGLGPDVQGVADVFKGATQDGFEPVYDRDRHFNYEPVTAEATTKGLTGYLRGTGRDERGVTEMVGDVEKILGPFKDLKRGDKDAMPAILPAVVGVKAKSSDPNDDTELEFIGAAAYRIAELSKAAYTYVSQSAEDLSKDIETLAGKDTSQRDFMEELKKHVVSAKLLAEEIEKAKDKKAIEELKTKVQEARDELAAIGEKIKTKAYNPSKAQEGLLRQAQTQQDQLSEYCAVRLQDPAYGGRATTQMKGVVNSLPEDIALNDQLTPSRSAIEAGQDAMPSTVMDGVNFITSDHTVIAAHIASRYGNIPPALADYITARIVYDRRHLPLTEAPLPRPELPGNRYSDFTLSLQRKFQDEWNRKLQELDAKLPPPPKKKTLE
jgi:hypothetical protein